MSALGELVLKSVVALRSRKPRHGARAFDDHAGNIRWQFETSRALFAKYPGFDVRNKRVLEIGCGTGGRTAYLAELGAARAVGIDINRTEIEVACREATRLFPHLASRLAYHVCTETERLASIGTFDVVVLIDCLEHAVSPPHVLRLAHGYTVPGGRCYASSLGWYHARGSHFDMMPFVNVLFSDEEILNVQRWLVTRPDYVPHRFDSNPPLARWQGLYDLRQRPGEYLGKLTLRDMKKLVRYSPFSSAKMHVLGWDRRDPIAALANTLRHIPVIQELMHSYVVMEFVR